MKQKKNSQFISSLRLENHKRNPSQIMKDSFFYWSFTLFSLRSFREEKRNFEKEKPPTM